MFCCVFVSFVKFARVLKLICRCFVHTGHETLLTNGRGSWVVGVSEGVCNITILTAHVMSVSR